MATGAFEGLGGAESTPPGNRMGAAHPSSAAESFAEVLVVTLLTVTLVAWLVAAGDIVFGVMAMLT